jgi:hypothetical protein
MSFLVRKLNKRDQLYQLVDSDSIEDIYADVPSNEFKTTKGTLSTWIIDTLDKLEDAVLAIAVSSTKISKMDFIVIDTELLVKNGLEYKKTYAGMDIPIPDLQDTHYDIMGVTLKKMMNCANVYKCIFAEESEEVEKYIVRFSEPQIKEMLKKAISENRVDKTKATKNIRETIEKLSAA